MHTFYEAEAHLISQGIDQAHLHTKDGRIDMNVSHPLKSETIENATNPEQLFAAAFGACFENALVFKAQQLKIALDRFEVTSKVGIQTEKNQNFQLHVELKVSLPGLNRDQALSLIAESQESWPFARAASGGIPIQIELVDRISPVM